ncbi:MAG: outer membrane beta-barrel protein [Agriterribacter sp.]
MKKVHLMVMGSVLLCLSAVAQSDTTITQSSGADTLRVGSIIIVKDGKESKSEDRHSDDRRSEEHHDAYKPNRPSRWKNNVSTNWLVVDIGFANHNDRTNYASAEAQDFVHGQTAGHPAAKSDFTVKTGSFNLNVWLFMQRMSLVKHIVNLKYGVGIELYKYYYKSDIKYVDGADPYVERQNVDLSRNKFAFDYVTVPLMVNINPNGNKRNGGLNISFGASASYLYGARNKQRSDDFGKQKVSGDFNLERWKLAYVGELGLGPVRLYGSYSITPLHQYGVDQHPYTVGLRFSSW